MRNTKKIISIIISVVMMFSCIGVVAFAEDDSLIGTTGYFDVLSYNIQGVPVPASAADGRDAMVDNILVGQQINTLSYDIVAIQEDYNYDLYMRDEIKIYNNIMDDDNNVIERHQTVHSGGIPLGDGLNVFSKYPQFNEDRESWKKTSGITSDGDELTYKGFLVTTLEIEDGYYLDVYDVHMDESVNEESAEARNAQFLQLADYIKKNSVYDATTGTYDHAVIVTGVFNACICNEDDVTGGLIIKNFLEAADLNDAWAVKTVSEIEENPADYSAYYTYAKETALTPDQAEAHYDSVERIVFADGNGIDLTCSEFGYIYLTDATGRSLSDHCAVEATMTYEIVEKVQDTGNNHDDVKVEAEASFLMRFLMYIASIFEAIGKWFQDFGNWA